MVPRRAVAVLVALLSLGLAPLVGPSPAAAAEGWRVTFTSTFSGNLPGVGAVSGKISGDISLDAVNDSTDLTASYRTHQLMDYEQHSGPGVANCTFTGLRDGYPAGIQVYDPKGAEPRHDVLMALFGGGSVPTGEVRIGAEQYSCPNGPTQRQHGAQMWACIAVSAQPASQGGRGQYYYALHPGETRTFTGSVSNPSVCPGATGTHTTTITLHSPPLAAPSAPLGLKVGATDSQLGAVIAAHWSPPTSTGGSPIASYIVRLIEAGTVVQTQTVDGSLRDAWFREVRYGTTYHVRVSARNGNGVEGPQTAAVGPAVPVPFDDTLTFVTRTFQDVVGRSPTDTERSTWAQRIEAHTATPGSMVQALRTGNDGTTNVDPIVRLYRAYFLRDPDVGGFDYWVGQRRRGRSLAWTSDAFVTTNEFKTMYAGMSNREFVRTVYSNVLGRGADQAGLDYWTAEIDSGRKTRGAVMLGFSESAEHRNRLNLHVQMLVLHLTLLDALPTGRQGDAGEQLVLTQGIAALAHDIIGRQEYVARVA